MKNIAFMLAALSLLTGCSSINNAGTATYTVKPFVTERGEVHCCEVSVTNGKEIASLDAHIEKRGSDYTVDLKERGVMAFKGQQIAAGVATDAAHLAGTATAIVGGALAAPAVASLAGAALTAGTMPAALAGAAAAGATVKAVSQ